jgi:hypothetical protein
MEHHVLEFESFWIFLSLRHLRSSVSFITKKGCFGYLLYPFLATTLAKMSSDEDKSDAGSEEYGSDELNDILGKQIH